MLDRSQEIELRQTNKLATVTSRRRSVEFSIKFVRTTKFPDEAVAVK